MTTCPKCQKPVAAPVPNSQLCAPCIDDEEDAREDYKSFLTDSDGHDDYQDAIYDYQKELT